MTDSTEILERNAASTARLETLAGGLSLTDLQHPLGGGWTVAVALTHLAFWDFRQSAALAHFAESGVMLEEDAVVNPALEAVAKGMEPQAAARLAVEAAMAVDAAVAGLGGRSAGVAARRRALLLGGAIRAPGRTPRADRGRAGEVAG